jgi:hypothetical protein
MTGAVSDIVEKMIVLRDSKNEIEGFLLPTGMSIEQIRAWSNRVLTNAIDKHNRNIQRFEGRTFQEDWAKPARYMSISSNTGSNASDFDVGLKIIDLIETRGRQTIDEIMYEFGAVEHELTTMTVNMLRNDHYLKDYTEHDGKHTLELLDRTERNKLMGLPTPEKKALTVVIDKSPLAYLHNEEPKPKAETEDPDGLPHTM